MEHIVQFAIGIDDEAIRKNISEHAETLLQNSYLMTLKELFLIPIVGAER